MASAGIWFGIEDGVFWAAFRGRFSDDDFGRYLEAVPAALGSSDFKGLMFTTADAPRMPSATQRKALSDLVESGAVATLRRHAIASDSAITRGVVTAMNWVSSKPYDERIFPTPEAALVWLGELDSTVSAELWQTVSASIRS